MLNFSLCPYTIRIRGSLRCDGSANSTAVRTLARVFLCPSDAAADRINPHFGPTNYLFNVGSGLVDYGYIRVNRRGQHPDGVVYEASSVRFSDITDGTANTIAASESIRGNGIRRTTLQDRRRQYLRSSRLFPACNAAASARLWWGNRCEAWVKGSYPFAAMTFYLPPNSDTPDCLTGAATRALMGPRSFHHGGVNTLFCDGHVAFLSDSIGPDIMHALATRAGGEHIDRPE
jgi:prepilin-type processing-associated H-X9-DG protein